jgi:hypothetical protein
MRAGLIFWVLALAACATAAGTPSDPAGVLDSHDFGRLRFERPEDFADLRREVEERAARMAHEEARSRAMPASQRPSRCAPGSTHWRS